MSWDLPRTSISQQTGAGGSFLVGGPFLSKIVRFDHHAVILEWIRAKTVATIRQLTNRYITLVDVLENDCLYHAEITHSFHIAGFPRHLQKLVM
jgi:hypothetical protein